MWGCVMCSGTAPVQAVLCLSVRARLCSREPQGVVVLLDGDTRGLRAAGQIVHSSAAGFELGAQAAARALLENTELDPETIVRKSLSVAADLCIYTNQNHTVEVL